MNAGWRRRAGRAWMALLLAVAGSGVPAAAAAPAPAPADCAALRTAYRSAVPAAQVCDAQSAKSCAARRVAALDDACRCEVSVNPARTQVLDQLLADYRAQGCAAQPALCNRMCAAPPSACGSASGATAVCGQR